MVPRSAEMQPTDSDTSAAQWSLCCVRFPTDSAVCLWARGAGGIPGEIHSWEVIEFEGKRQHREEERIVRAQWISKMTATQQYKGEMGLHKGGCSILQTEIRLSYFLFITENSLKLQEGIYVDIYIPPVDFSCFLLQATKPVYLNSTFSNLKLPHCITLYSFQHHRMLKMYLHSSIRLSSSVHINVFFSAAYTLFAQSCTPPTSHERYRFQT